MTDKAPPFPQGDQVPTIERMADLLASAVPEDDRARARARALLADDILPVELADLSSHPQPVKLARAAYESVAADLDEAAAGEQLAAVVQRAWRSKLRAIDKLALALAIARYLHDHPAAAGADAVAPWITPAVSRWRDQSSERVASEAKAAHGRLEALTAELRASEPALWRELGASAQRTRMALGSAQTGSFATAAGSLSDFLRAAGEAHDTMQFH